MFEETIRYSKNLMKIIEKQHRDYNWCPTRDSFTENYVAIYRSPIYYIKNMAT